MGSKMKSWTINVQMGNSKAIGSNVPNLMKDVPNFVKDVPNFVNDVPRVPKCIMRWGLAPVHFLMGSKKKSWTIHIQMGVLKAIGLDVPNLMKNVPKFVKDVPKVPKYVLRWGSTPNHFLVNSPIKPFPRCLFLYFFIYFL